MRDIASQDVWTESQYQQHNLGEFGMDKWGRKFRYIQAGSTALVTGNLLQSAVENTNYNNMATPTIAAKIGRAHV